MALAVLAANIYFWRNTRGYFARGEEMPLLHTWSLAVEEQFYLIMPLFLLMAFRLSAPQGRLLLPVVIVSMLGSLAASIYAVAAFPGAAFYFLRSRAWELLIGSVLALIPARWISGNRLARETITYAGFACIVAACVFDTEATPFPGLAALVPCSGTAAIIWANSRGDGGMSLTSAGAILASRPFVFLGLISYSLYLWHWPLLTFGSYWSLWPLSLTSRLGLLALTFLLAILSWRFVEAPIRSLVVFPARRSLFSFAALTFSSSSHSPDLLFSLGDIRPGFLIKRCSMRKLNGIRPDVTIGKRRTLETTPFRILVRLTRILPYCFGETRKRTAYCPPSTFLPRILTSRALR